MNNKPLQTIYFSKRFTSGLLTGLTVHTSLTRSDVSHIRIGTKGRDAVTHSRWIVVDASFQNYAR